jgi:Domain of unknown function (DUF4160)
VTIEEKILTPILEYFMSIVDIDSHIDNSRIKERIETIGRMQIIIYSNDHEPPHFHVKSKDNEIDAKFTIKDCTYLSGKIEAKDFKRVQTFHRDIKTQKVMEMIWNKKHNTGTTND